MSNILKKYEELKDSARLDAPQPKIIGANVNKDQTPYTKGNKDKQVADDESGIVALEKKTGLTRYGISALGSLGYTSVKKYGDTITSSKNK